MQSSNPWRPIAEAECNTSGHRVLLYREGYAESMTVGFWSQDQQAWVSILGSIPFAGVTHYRECPERP